MSRVTRVCLAVISAMAFSAPLIAADPSSVQKAWGILDSAVADKSFARRHDAVLALGLVADDAKAVAMAETALGDREEQVREAAAMTLGKLHSTSSIPKLEQALNDKEVSVVLAAAHALYELHDKRGFEIYYEILLGERKSAKGLVAGQEAILKDRKKLAEMGIEQGVGFSPFTSVGWEVFKMVHKDDVSPVRAAAARILTDDPDPRSARALVLSCTDKNWIIRAAALEALARRGDQANLEDVEPHMADVHDEVRYTAAAATIRLSSARLKPGVKKTGTEENAWE